VCMCACMYTHVCVCVCMRMCVSKSACVYTCVCICVWARACHSYKKCFALPLPYDSQPNIVRILGCKQCLAAAQGAGLHGSACIHICTRLRLLMQGGCEECLAAAQDALRLRLPVSLPIRPWLAQSNKATQATEGGRDVTGVQFRSTVAR